MLSKRSFASLALLAALAAAPLAFADDWEKEFQRDFAKPESWNKFAAITKLDPANNKARDLLESILDKQNWYLRTAAINALQGASGDALEDLKKDVRKHSSVTVREGIATALGQRPDHEGAAALAEALSDKDERVRRAAAIALATHGTKEAVTALIACWEKEKQLDVSTWIRASLEKISGKFLGPRPEDWKAWWKAMESDWKTPENKPPPQPGQPGPDGKPAPQGEKSEEDKKAEADGKKSSEETTVLRDVELNFKEAGKGGPLFVLPEYGYSSMYLEKSILGLGDTARLTYIDLPGATGFKNLPNGPGGYPMYPIDKLCEAFDELRKAKKQDRIGLMAHGIAGWVAIRYASKYPKNVSHLILVSSWTGGKAWADGLKRVEANCKQTGDVEYEHLTQADQSQYQAKGPEDDDAMQRAGWTGYFTDPRNFYASFFWNQKVSLPMGTVGIPMDFDVAKEKGLGVPTLLIYGTNPRAMWTSPQDMKQFTKSYPNAEVVECPNTNRMPMIEDPEIFMKAVRGFFKKYPFKKSDKKDEKK